MMFQNLKVGDMVFYLRNRDAWDGAAPITITKVGRKWATFQNQWGSEIRFDMADGDLDGRYLGYVFPSYETWKNDRDQRMARRAAEKAWDEFQQTVRRLWKRPEHLDADAIRELTEKLRDADDAR